MPIVKSWEHAVEIALDSKGYTSEQVLERVFMFAFVGHEYGGVEVLAQFKARGFEITIEDGAVVMRKPRKYEPEPEG